MEKTIKVLIKEPYKEPIVKEIDNNLKSLQNIVGGYIECVPFPKVKGIDLIVNEEGKLDQLEGNFFLPHYQDCVVGTAIVASYNDDGEFTSLGESQIKKAKEYINYFKLEQGENLYRDFNLLNINAKLKMKSFDEEMV